jgi:iron complex transport system permease protein
MKLRRVLLISLPLLVMVAMAGLCFGSATISLGQILGSFRDDGDTAVGLILWQLRLPRVAAGLLAGMGLSVSGVLLQSVTANDLAGPNIIGINSGAGFAILLLLTAFPEAGNWLSLGAFLGAFAAAMVILLIGNRLGGSRTGILLIGLSITTILNAAISFLSLLDEGVLAQYNHFTVGSLKAVRMEELAVPFLVIAVAFAVSLAISSRLGILCLGDAAAAALGIRVKRLRMTALVCAAASAAAVVSFAGLLGFVGLVVPHIAKKLAGEQPAGSLPVAVLSGGVLVIVADLLGRTLFAPSELPVGILMSLVGGPYFLILLCRRNRHAHF